jgi:threonine 3-dehydrogenase
MGMPSLITGGSGLVGSELAHILINRGEKVVVFDRVKNKRLIDIENQITFLQGDLSIWSEVFNVIKEYKITRIFHMGAMLTFESEHNPWGSFQTNVVGTYNILEASRLLNIESLMFTSSIGTFDPSTVSNHLSDTVLQRPRDFYGVGKLYCEGLGRMYRKKFGLDFRALRYPSVVGPGVTTQGHWDAPMIQAILKGQTFQCPAVPDRGNPMLYFKDAALAAYELLRAPKDSIKMIIYNVGGINRVTPKDIENALRKHLDNVKVDYVTAINMPPPPGEINWDDSYARNEWGWAPQFFTIDKVVSDFIQELKNAPVRYGIN